MLYYRKIGEATFFFENEEKLNSGNLDDAFCNGTFHQAGDLGLEFRLILKDVGHTLEVAHFRKSCTIVKTRTTFSSFNKEQKKYEGFEVEQTWRIFEGQSFNCIDEFSSKMTKFLNEVREFVSKQL